MKKPKFKILFAVIIASFFIISFAIHSVNSQESGATRQEQMMRYPYPNYNSNTSSFSPNVFGQTHTYDVLFRYNGEAVVSSQIKITNNDEKILNSIIFGAKKLSPRRIYAWQYSTKETCVYWRDNAPAPLELCKPVYYGNNISGYGYNLRTDKGWHRIEPVFSQGKIKLNLVQPLKSGEQTTLVINYRGFGYGKKGLFGRRKFDFETLATSDEIQNTTVTVDVDTDLYFRGQKSKISYREEQFSTPMMGEARMKSTVDQGLSYGTVAGWGAPSYYDGSYRSMSITKTAKLLAPGETFHVKGIYATSWFGIYYPAIFGTIIGIVAFIVIVYYVQRYIKKRKGQKNDLFSRKSDAKSPVTASDIMSIKKEMSFLSEVVVGFLGAILVLVVNMLIVFFIYRFESMFSGSGGELIGLMIFILLFVFVVVSLLVLPVYIGYRYGKKSGLIVFGWQIFFLVLFVILLMFWRPSFLTRPHYYY